MTTERRIARVGWHALRVTPKTVWSFVEIEDEAGRTGTGEATLIGREAEMQRIFATLASDLPGLTPEAVDLARARSDAKALAQFAVISAVDQAIEDLDARQAGVRLCQRLGDVRRDAIPAYANVNRGIVERTPQGFSASARAAIDDGFDAVKIAPFDGVTAYGDERAVADAPLIDAALERISAVRDAIGPTARLMVDCHWRLNRRIAEDVLRACEPFDLHWLECPVPESSETLDTIRALRAFANDRGILLAGCEEMCLLEGFQPFIDARAYDVLMPDVKYVGGLREMLRIADAMSDAGIAFSPHNPSGPVSHAASLHVCAVVPNLDRLELQYAETSWFDALVNGAPRAARNGEIDVPRDAGLGVRLDPNVVRTLSEGGR